MYVHQQTKRAFHISAFNRDSEEETSVSPHKLYIKLAKAEKRNQKNKKIMPIFVVGFTEQTTTAAEMAQNHDSSPSSACLHFKSSRKR